MSLVVYAELPSLIFFSVFYYVESIYKVVDGLSTPERVCQNLNEPEINSRRDTFLRHSDRLDQPPSMGPSRRSFSRCHHRYITRMYFSAGDCIPTTCSIRVLWMARPNGNACPFFFFFFCLAPLHAAVYYRPALFLSAPNSFCTVNGMNSADHLHRSLATLIKTVSFHEYVLPCCQYRLASYTSCITGYASSDNSYVLDSLILCARTSISSYVYSSSCSFFFFFGRWREVS